MRVEKFVKLVKYLSKFSDKKILSDHFCIFSRSVFPFALVRSPSIPLYPPHKNKKISTKETLKSNLSKI